MVKKYISEICSKHCIFTSYKAKCPRGKWTSKRMNFSPIPQYGQDTECPLMQFNNIKKTKSSDVNLTEMNTWEICASCHYAETNKNGTVSIANAHTAHCIDCPVMQLREAIQETNAEARCSL